MADWSPETPETDPAVHDTSANTSASSCEAFSFTVQLLKGNQKQSSQHFEFVKPQKSGNQASLI